ncbi:MAG TPA: ABC transporter substrate-binding protein [Reyranella sp.]|nr:ABC transporter substrate-binding protein [Reyranella sp.]
MGVLDPGDPTEFATEFRNALIGLGYIEGKNIRLEIRSGGNNADTLARRAEELVRLKVDVIAVRLTPALRAATQATHEIPVIMSSVGSPVETGFVASLAHPGGNVTGMSLGGVPLSAKRLQIIREVLPSLRRLAVVTNRDEPYSEMIASTMDRLGSEFGIQTIEIRTTGSTLVASLATMEHERPDAIFALASLPAQPIAEVALRLRMPYFSTQRTAVEAGALMSYSGRLDEQFQGAAMYVDKVLKGAKPANLPVEEPSRFELSINMKTARVLGITIPRTLLAQADALIE